MIKFTENVDGIYEAGQTVTLEPGLEDAYVNWREVAVYVEPKEQVKTVDAPPKDKMMRTPPKKKGFVNAQQT